MDYIQIIMKILNRVIDRYKAVDAYGAKGFLYPPKEFYQGTPYDPSYQQKLNNQKGTQAMSMDYGSLIGGIGSLIGGAGSLLGSSGKDRSLKQQAWYQGELLQHMPAHAVEGAKRAGIHPLVVMGHNPITGPSVAVGGSSGPDYRGFESAMRGLGQSVKDIIGKELNPYQRTKRALDLQYDEQRVIGQKLANDLTKMELEQLRNKPPSPSASKTPQAIPGAPGTEIIPKQVTPEGNPGVEVGDNPAMQWFTVNDGTGKYYIRGMSERFADASEEDPIAKSQYWSAQGGARVKGLKKPPFPPPKHVKAPIGKMWRWFPHKGWKLVPAETMLKPSHRRQRQIHFAPTFE